MSLRQTGLLRATLVLVAMLVVVLATSCKSSFCKGYRDACIKDCEKHPPAGKTCGTQCDEQIVNQPAYKSCVEK